MSGRMKVRITTKVTVLPDPLTTACGRASPKGEALTGCTRINKIRSPRQSFPLPRDSHATAMPTLGKTNYTGAATNKELTLLNQTVHSCRSGASVEKSPPAKKTARRVSAPAYLPAAARRQPTRPRRLATSPAASPCNKKTESAKLSVFYSIFGYFSVRYSVFSISTTVSSTIVSASSSSSGTISLPASGSNSTPLRFASNFLKSFEKKNPIAIITANTII